MYSLFARACMALLVCSVTSTALAATITATSALRGGWTLAGSSTSLQGSPVTLEIDFDDTLVAGSATGAGWISIAGARQAAVRASVSFTAIGGSGSANGNILSLGVVLDEQPAVDRSFFANGRFIRVFVDENPDQLPLSVDINSFAINLYGGAPAGTGSSLTIGDAIKSFIATPRQAGQRVAFYPSQVQSFIWGPDDIATVSLRTNAPTNVPTNVPTTSVPAPAGVALVLAGLGVAVGVRRRRRAA